MKTGKPFPTFRWPMMTSPAPRTRMAWYLLIPLPPVLRRSLQNWPAIHHGATKTGIGPNQIAAMRRSFFILSPRGIINCSTVGMPKRQICPTVPICWNGSRRWMWKIREIWSVTWQTAAFTSPVRLWRPMVLSSMSCGRERKKLQNARTEFLKSCLWTSFLKAAAVRWRSLRLAAMQWRRTSICSLRKTRSTAPAQSNSWIRSL